VKRLIGLDFISFVLMGVFIGFYEMIDRSLAIHKNKWMILICFIFF